jgi:7-keto-8-aminopelargonate synthetase-like enzyme
MLGWLTLLCVQLTVFIVGLAWGWHCHQRRLFKQQQLMNRLQRLAQNLQSQLVSQGVQLAQAKLHIQNLQTEREQPPEYIPIRSPMAEISDYDKIRQLFKQGIAPQAVQDSFNLSRSELEILVALQKTAA